MSRNSSYLSANKSSLSIKENYQNSLTLANEILGEPVNPPWSEVIEKWKNIRANFSTFSPRTFVIIFDVKKHNAVLSHGLSLLGYEDDHLFSAREMVNLTHENQKEIMAYHISMVFSIFLKEPELIKDKDLVYSTIRSLMDKQGKYWLVNQVTIPIQYDSNGIMAKYLCSYRILKEYNNEPFQSNVFLDAEFSSIENKLRSRLKMIKANVLEALGFTNTEREVIKHMSNRVSSKEIIVLMNIKKRTLDSHRRNILKTAKIIFPNHKFRYASNFVDFLQLQEFI